MNYLMGLLGTGKEGHKGSGAFVVGKSQGSVKEICFYPDQRLIITGINKSDLAIFLICSSLEIHFGLNCLPND